MTTQERDSTSPSAPRVDTDVTAGLVAHYGLTSWWLETFTPAEREYVADRFRPLIAGAEMPARSLVEGPVTWQTGSIVGFLNALSTWFMNRRDRPIARRILARAERERRMSVLDRHFLYANIIRTYYPDRRHDPIAFATALAACEAQIELAPRAARAFRRGDPTRPLPDHLGFRQLAIVREKQRRYDEAEKLARTAQRQGWADEWDRRIARIERKRARATPPE